MKFRTLLILIGLMFPLIAPMAAGQASPLLRITELKIPPGQLLQVSFSDLGTGATNYLLESTPGLGGGGAWSTVPGSLVLNLGNGNFQAIAPSPTSSVGYYRIQAQGGSSGPVIATFATSGIRIVEGTIASPTVTFNAPHVGLLRYTLNGVTGTGEPISQRGEVMVNGTSVMIPLDLMDDDVVGTLTFLTLTIEGMPGVIPGAISQTLITIDENDAVWKGSLSLDGAELGFALLIDEVNGAKSARLQGEDLGFFSSLDAPATLTFTGDMFESITQTIQLPAEDSYLKQATELTLNLKATHGLDSQVVSGNLVEGVGELISRVLGQPHLDRTNSGPFVLVKPPVAPSTNQVTLLSVSNTP